MNKHKTLLIEKLQESGFTVDRWGHYTKDCTFKYNDGQTLSRKVRFKMKNLTFRLETKREGDTIWHKYTTTYYGQLTKLLTPAKQFTFFKGMLVIGNPAAPPPAPPVTVTLDTFMKDFDS